MQMNGLAELITIAKYWPQWTDPRLIIAVLHNNDFNQVTCEMRAIENSPKFEASQSLPDVDYAAFARSPGLHGDNLDQAEQLAAWEGALAADRPTVLAVRCDPDVPPVPPHATFEQAKSLPHAVLGGDRDAAGFIKQGAKQKVQQYFSRRHRTPRCGHLHRAHRRPGSRRHPDLGYHHRRGHPHHAAGATGVGWIYSSPAAAAVITGHVRAMLLGRPDVLAPVWDASMSAMTDHNLAQATLLIAALRARIGDMTPKLARVEREATCRHTSRDRALRRDAMLLRRDVSQAQFLIARLQHRFPGADIEHTSQIQTNGSRDTSP
jgi:hypothetical protein